MRPLSEAERLSALRQLDILDTPPEPHFDAVCETARDLFGMPVALVTLIDQDRQWFKARCGLDIDETSRDHAFCHFTIQSDEVLVVEDAAKDPRFASNPYVAGEAGIRFYAGAPLVLRTGIHLGSLCVVDTQPRTFGEEDRERLRRLAAVVTAHLHLHEAHRRQREDAAALAAQEAMLRVQSAKLRRREAMIAQTEHLANIGTWEVELATRTVTWSDNLYAIYGRPLGEPVALESILDAHDPADTRELRAAMASITQTHGTFDLNLPLIRRDGERRIARAVGAAEVIDGRPTRVFGILHDITPYVTAVSEAQEANRLLILAEEMGDFGHWHIDLATGRFECSQGALRIFGLDRRERGSMPDGIASLFHPDDRTRIEAVIQESLATGGECEFEARALRPDGTTRHVLARGTAERDVGGAIRTLFGVVIDVSRQKALERQLRESTTLLEATLDHMDQGLLMVDAEERVQVVNRRALDLLDLPASLMNRKPSQTEVREYQIAMGEFAGADAQVQNWFNTARLQTDQSVYERERPNGTVLEIRTVPLPDGGAVRTYTDVTSRKRAERARAESEARYRLFAEHASDLIILGQADGRRSYISPAVETLLGYTVEEAHCLHMRDFIHAEDLPRVFATTVGLTAEAPQASVVFRMRHRNGATVWVEGAFTRAETEGRVTIVTALRDVTERQRQAEELTRAKEAAEEAQMRAEQANQAKTEFLASMSHEIRTPLNGILGYADLLITEAELAPDQRRQVERIQSAGSALLTVVDDVLDFSKIEAGQITLEPAPFSPLALADDAVSIVRSVADRKSLPVSIVADPGLPQALMGDEARLRQVLLNLLNNAVKFTHRGRVTLHLDKGPGGPAGETITFRVEDTGIGIPAEKLGRLFQRFSQVDSSIRREFGGTGLGLAISRQLVDLMGGRIAVESVPGEGSTFAFTVTLPQASSPAGPPAAPAPEAARPARILLVEDLDINQELARAVLEAAGHQVDVATDGAEAVEAVQRGTYDLVLMDVQMPGMDGLSATRAIRALDHGARNVPIIAMTANVLPQQVTACRQAGMTDHVGKPFKRNELHAAVGRALGTGLPLSVEEARAMKPVLDHAVIDELEALGGLPMVTRLLGQFEDAFRGRFQTPEDRGQMARDAHTLVSSAGMLGLSRLSEACARLERACLEGADPAPLLREVMACAEETLRAVAAWRAARVGQPG
ncbi:MAG TPA: PAS domain S-box protein [Microvirga sp.]|jgi:PAS domain S-box-containing protein